MTARNTVALFDAPMKISPTISCGRIGRASATAFAKDGARLVVSGRRETEGKALEAELRGLGAEAAFIQADVRHENEVPDLVDRTVASFGRIDAAVNNAGTEGL